MSHQSSPIISANKLACLPPAPQKRKSHSLVCYKDKTLILFGGYSGSHHTNDLWIHTPFATGGHLDLMSSAVSTTWKRIDMQQSLIVAPSKRHCHACAIYKYYMVLFGGDSGGNEILNDLWLLDLRTSRYQWSKVEYNGQQLSSHNIPKARYAHTAVVIQDTLWIYGGFTRKSSKTGGMYLDDLWAYHFPSGTWRQIITPKEERPAKRCYHSAVIYDETNILVFGGSSMGQYLNDTWMFDTRTEKWKRVNILNSNGSGRTSNTTSPPIHSKKLSIQDIRNEHDSPIPRGKHAATIYGGNVMFVTGGFSGLFRENDFWCLHILQNNDKGCIGKWQRLDSAPQSANMLPIARDSHSIVMVNKYMFLFGGSGTGKLLNDLWIFDCSKVINNAPTLRSTRNETKYHTYEANDSQEIRKDSSPKKNSKHVGKIQDSFQSIASNPSENSISPNTSQISQVNRDDSDINETEEGDSVIEEELFGKLSEALQHEERRRMDPLRDRQDSPKSQSLNDRKNMSTGSKLEHTDEQDDESNSSQQYKSPYQSHSNYGTPARSMQSLSSENRSKSSQRLNSSHNDSIPAQRLNSIERQLQLLIERQDLEEKRNEEFRSQVMKELSQAKNIMKKQGEALEALENVVHKEIQTRVAGEDKAQAYFNFMSSQQANALALQTHQYQLSVERISSIIQHLMNKDKPSSSPSISQVEVDSSHK